MKTSKRKKNIAALVCFMAGMGMGYCQTPNPPDYWQTTTASTVDEYADERYDTVISRTCGHSVTVSCSRIPGGLGRPQFHRFALRCMNSGNYFKFDLLPSSRDTTAIGGYFCDDRTYYYIRDMRVSDSICFFCGTRLKHRSFLSLEMMPTLLNDVYMYQGFFGRFDMKLMLRDSDAVYYPIVPDPPQGPVYPVPLTEWYPRVQITYIEEAATLDKLWVDNGLKVDGFKHAEYYMSPSQDPYTNLSMGIDPEFDIASAHAYILGRRADSMSQSCLVEVTDHLGFVTNNPDYEVWVPNMPEEILTDVTGNDCRVIFSSRIFKNIVHNGTTYKYDYTAGIRYKDLFDIDDDYHNHLHLYSHQDAYPNNPLGDEEYAHVCRLKNYKAPRSPYAPEVYYYKDFCFVYTCKDGQYEYYQPGVSRTFVHHIEADMEANVSFELGYRSPYLTEAGGYLVSDVAYIGNYKMNCLAVSYRCEAGNIYAYYPYVELIDWGYKAYGYYSYLHFQDGFDHSVRLSTTALPTSLDVFLDGKNFLVGGYDYTGRTRNMTTQRRSCVQASSSDTTCSSTWKIYNQQTFDVLHAEIESGMRKLNDNDISWKYLHPVATKHSVVNICTR